MQSICVSARSFIVSLILVEYTNERNSYLYDSDRLAFFFGIVQSAFCSFGNPIPKGQYAITCIHNQFVSLQRSTFAILFIVGEEFYQFLSLLSGVFSCIGVSTLCAPRHNRVGGERKIGTNVNGWTGSTAYYGKDSCFLLLIHSYIRVDFSWCEFTTRNWGIQGKSRNKPCNYVTFGVIPR